MKTIEIFEPGDEVISPTTGHRYTVVERSWKDRSTFDMGLGYDCLDEKGKEVPMLLHHFGFVLYTPEPVEATLHQREGTFHIVCPNCSTQIEGTSIEIHDEPDPEPTCQHEYTFERIKMINSYPMISISKPMATELEYEQVCCNPACRAVVS